MTRGEVWWAELAGDAGFRPVVLVSRTEAMARRRNVTIAEITRVVRSLPSEVALFTSDGMPVECVINADNLHTIPQDRLRQQITQLSDERIFQAIRGHLQSCSALSLPINRWRRQVLAQA